MRLLPISTNPFLQLILIILLFVSTIVQAQNPADFSNNYQPDRIAGANPNNPFSTPLNIISVIPSPTSGTSSLAWDGQYLWVGSYPDQIFKIRPSDGTVLKTLNTNINRPYGLAYVNGSLWVADNNTKTINKVDTATGNTILSFVSFNQGYDAGLAWDGTNLWHSDLDVNTIYVFDTLGTLISPYSINLAVCHGLTFQDNYLWASDNNTHKLYKVDTTSFAFIDTIVSPKQFPNGIAFDGQYMWVAENQNSSGIDSIYQIGLGLTGLIESAAPGLNEIMVFPNPSAGEFFIAGEMLIDEINIFNLTGQVVHTAQPMSEKFSVHLKTPGIYFMELKPTHGNSIVKKLAVQY